jgi:hypothetical protein
MACGAVNADVTIALAICLRTPLIAKRSSPPAGTDDRATTAVAGAPLTALSTSARVIVPFGPLPSTTVRSTPRSRASLRTGGFARTRISPLGAAVASSAACAPTAAAETRAGCGREPVSGATASVLRGRRVSLPLFGPLPTSTSIFSSVLALGAGPPAMPGSAGTCGTMSAEAATRDWPPPASAAGASPDGSVSKVMIGEPTSTVSPSAWWSCVTTPAYGDGISTAALAVSTSTIGWLRVTWSPGCTSHLRISPSVSPSPRSGSLKSLYDGIR